MMKLVIDISEELLEEIKDIKYPTRIERTVQKGIPLENIKSEIQKLEIFYDGNITFSKRQSVLRILNKYIKEDK